MKDTINPMQKVRRLVLKCLFCILVMNSFNSGYGQTNSDKDNYLIANKVLDKYRDGVKTITILDSNSNKNEELRKYYLYKYFGESSASVFTVDRNDSIIHKGEKETERFKEAIFSKYKPLDTIFSKADIEAILKRDNYISWKASKLDKVILVSRTEVKPINYIKNVSDEKQYKRMNYSNISKPFYSLDKKYAGIWFNSPGYSALLLFKKINNDWIEIYILPNNYIN